MTDRRSYIIEVIRRECSYFKDSLVEEIKVLLNELDELPAMQNASKTLAALNAAGVDNWEGYSYAMELMEE